MRKLGSTTTRRRTGLVLVFFVATGLLLISVFRIHSSFLKEESIILTKEYNILFDLPPQENSEKESLVLPTHEEIFNSTREEKKKKKKHFQGKIESIPLTKRNEIVIFDIHQEKKKQQKYFSPKEEKQQQQKAKYNNNDDKENITCGCYSLQCSLNGCFDENTGLCKCRRPWTGSTCSKLLTKPSPVAAKSLYNFNNDNSWSGPIFYDDNQYHMYLAIYRKGSLFHTKEILHGVSSQDPTGPYEWNKLKVTTPLHLRTMKNKKRMRELKAKGADSVAAFVKTPNPSFLLLEEDGKKRYCMFIYNSILLSDSHTGPFIDNSTNKMFPTILVHDGSTTRINLKVIQHNNTYYGVFQETTKLYHSNSSIFGPWKYYSDINISNDNTQSNDYLLKSTLEDPEIWIDECGYWHIINHAYQSTEWYNCSRSVVSTHLYSMNGKNWSMSPEQPYGHTVEYEDNTTVTYATLERPYLLFNREKQPTHIVLAASMKIGNEGCSHTQDCINHPKKRFCSCVNCKYLTPGGTIMLTLDI